MKKALFFLLLVVLFTQCQKTAVEPNANGIVSNSLSPIKPKQPPLTWVKFTKSYSDFSTFGNINVLNLDTLTSDIVVHATQIVVDTAFAGNGFTYYLLGVGIGNNPFKYYSALNILDAPPAQIAGVYPQQGDGLDTLRAGNSIVAEVNSGGTFLNNALQGTVDIYIFYSTLP